MHDFNIPPVVSGAVAVLGGLVLVSTDVPTVVATDSPEGVVPTFWSLLPETVVVSPTDTPDVVVPVGVVSVKIKHISWEFLIQISLLCITNKYTNGDYLNVYNLLIALEYYISALIKYVLNLPSAIDPAVDVPLTAALVVPVGPAVVELTPVGNNLI